MKVKVTNYPHQLIKWQDSWVSLLSFLENFKATPDECIIAINSKNKLTIFTKGEHIAKN